MIYEASFDLASRITFTEHKRKPLDLHHLQGAMFLDRPDLWPSRPHKKAQRGSRPHNGQIPFSFYSDPIPQCTGPRCPSNQPARDAIEKHQAKDLRKARDQWEGIKHQAAIE